MVEQKDGEASQGLNLLFGVLAFLILAGTLLVAIGGVYFTFINPSF